MIDRLECPLCGDRLYFSGGAVIVGLAQGVTSITPAQGEVRCPRGHYTGLYVERPRPPEEFIRIVDPSDDNKMACPKCGHRAWFTNGRPIDLRALGDECLTAVAIMLVIGALHSCGVI